MSSNVHLTGGFLLLFIGYSPLQEANAANPNIPAIMYKKDAPAVP